MESNRIIVQYAIELLWLVLALSLPTTIAAAMTGFLISLVQALTQLQDQTLQFLLKLLAVVAVLALTYPWMGNTLFNYSELVFDQISKMR